MNAGANMPLAKLDDGWFSEVNEVLWQGQAMSLKIDKILHEEVSKYQTIAVLQSATYGKVLVLDGAIQLTERDEFAYHEMMANLPLRTHPEPKNVLIVGGGDGGVAREVLKHPGVEQCVICDIDERVTAHYVTQRSYKRLRFSHIDGAKYLEDHIDEFDVIITDSSDPIGPAETLYSDEYFAALAKSLREGGIVAQQGECVWLGKAEFPAKIVRLARHNFPLVDYAVISIPTYPCGQIGCLLASKSGTTNFREPLRPLHAGDSANTGDVSLKYYNTEIHRSAFALPTFARDALDASLKRDDVDTSLGTNTLISVGISGDGDSSTEKTSQVS